MLKKDYFLPFKADSMRHSILLGLCLAVVSCSRVASMSVIEVTPSEVGEAMLPAEVTIRGRGLTRSVSLSLDDQGRAAVSPPSVVFGETQVNVVEHAAADELRVWVEGLAPGSYDVHVVSGGAKITVPDAFRVVGSDVPTEGGGTTDGALTREPSSNGTANSNEPVAEDGGSVTRVPADSNAGASAAATNPEGVLSSGDDASVNSSVGPVEAGSDAARRPAPEAGVCVDATRLFFDDYEAASFDSWTGFDTTGSCQTSGIDSSDAVSGERSFEANITCASSGDHENYGGLQFNGDLVRGNYSDSGDGIDSPFGVVIDFWARANFDFRVNEGQWVAFLVLAGTCDWSDEVFSVGTGNETSRLAISHATVDGGTTDTFPGARQFPKDAWTKVTTYVNYYDGTFVVWQDGAPVVRANFVRPGTTLCHVRIGAYVSGDTTEARVMIDDPVVWKLNAELDSVTSAPCFNAN